MGAGRIRIGCSGWSYPDWRGRAYPTREPAARWFDTYQRRFDTVELNTTFYRLPSESAVDAWRERARPGFCYAAKVARFASHRKKLTDPAGPDGWVARHVDRLGRLGPVLGPNLVQLPPRWRRDVGRLEAFLAVAPPSLRWAVELRDPSWLHDDTFEVLARHGAALCIHDLLADHPWVCTTDWSYVRFHGAHALDAPYRDAYTGRRLWRVAERFEAWRDEGRDVFAYFNNDHRAHAWSDAAWLADRLEVALR